MKDKYLFNILMFLFAFLVNVNNSATAATIETFFSQASDNNTLISESSGVFSSSITYTPNSFIPSNVINASLRIFLSDDLTSFFPNGLIDAPREFARLTSVTDGAQTVSSLPSAVEVDPQLFDAVSLPSITPAQITAAAVAGIENPSVTPSELPYFDLDVTNLILLSNSGQLDFSLEALNLYSTISPGSSAHDLILADAAFLGVNASVLAVLSGSPLPVFEDYIFNRAELRVEFVPAPPAIFLIGVGGLIGLLFNRKRKV